MDVSLDKLKELGVEIPEQIEKKLIQENTSTKDLFSYYISQIKKEVENEDNSFLVENPNHFICAVIQYSSSLLLCLPSDNLRQTYESVWERIEPISRFSTAQLLKLIVECIKTPQFKKTRKKFETKNEIVEDRQNQELPNPL